MPDLAKLQRSFQQYIEGENEDIVEHIVTTSEAQSEHRLAAYYNAYRARLIEAIAYDLPVTQAFIGDEKFEYLIINYIKAYPSKYTSVRWVGKNLSHFVKQQESIEQQDFLAELIDFEWSQNLVFDNKNQNKIFKLEDMIYSPEQWPSLKFEFIPTLLKREYFFNVNAYWHAVQNETELPEIQKDQYSTQWILWRKELDPNWRSLDVHEAWAIEQAQLGVNFEYLCEGLTEWIDPENVALTAAGFLKQWIDDQLLISVYLD